MEPFWESSEGKFYDDTYTAGRGDIVQLGREMVENLNFEISKEKNSTVCLNNGEYGGKTNNMRATLYSGEKFKGEKKEWNSETSWKTESCVTNVIWTFT